jgi:bacterioferritin (cytochrome b1)
MKKLADLDRDRMIDLLAQRLDFERTGARLYDAALERVVGSRDAMIRRAGMQLAIIRQQEREHASWLERQLVDLGAPDLITPRVKVGRLLSEGIVRVALDPASSIGSVFDSLLAAELVDHAGWNLLIDLAAEAGDDDAHEQLRARLTEENKHLHAIRTIVLAIARRDLLGVETDVTRKAA